MKIHGLLAAVGAAATLLACGGAPNDTTASALKACANGQTTEGIDVSKWDGTIDWSTVAQSKAFAFIRVSDGANYFDPTFDTNWTNAKAAGVYRGVYQFFRPTQSATAQADLLLQHMGTLGNGDLPPVLDVEVTDGASGSQIRAGVDAWSARVQQATGITPIVYTSPGFWASVGGGDESDGLWIANWGVTCPSIPSSWTGWSFWQYSDKGHVPGISSAVDLNRFNGSLADLAAYSSASVGGSSSSPPPPSTDDAGAPPSPSNNDAGSGVACVTDGDCNPGVDGSGQICVQNVCVAGCNADWECPGSTLCVNGTCQ